MSKRGEGMNKCVKCGAESRRKSSSLCQQCFSKELKKL